MSFLALVLVIFCILGVIYFIPSIVAYDSRYFGIIVILNVLFGWSFFGWIGLLIWAIIEKKKLK